MGTVIAAIGLVGALVVGGLLLVFLVLRGRLDALSAGISSTRHDVDRLGTDVRAREVPKPSIPEDDELARPEDAPATPADVAARVDPIHDELLGLRREVQTLVRRVGELTAEFETERNRRLEETIEERFQRKGFTSVRLLGSPSEEPVTNARIPLEGVKGGITYKGYVVIDDGRIVDEKMTSSYEVFP